MSGNGRNGASRSGLHVEEHPHLAPKAAQDGKLIDLGLAETTAVREGLNAKARYFGSNGTLQSSIDSDIAGISRPTSASSMRIRVEKPNAEAIKSQGWYARPPNTFEDTSVVTTPTRGLDPIFFRRDGAKPYGEPTLYSRLRLQWSQFVANALSSAFLFIIVAWALAVRLIAAIPAYFAPRAFDDPKEWDEAEKYKDEKLVKSVGYYAETCGFRIHDEVCETQDGYYLRVHRIVDPQNEHKKQSDGRGGYPVLIMHGLFQSSGSFVTSEERSLAFWLARHGGYQVFLGNNRGVFDMGHKTLKRSDPRFWDYNIRELAIYDLPALVDYVRKATGYDTIAYIGHSQGNGTMFISLSKTMVPELGSKLSYFGALAPAVFAGPLTSCFPFTVLRTMHWQKWKRFFGVLDFVPLMKIGYDWTPAYPFAALGYQMFAFLFAWTDANWLMRRKAKMFRFTPQPVSSASIYWWAGAEGFSTRGCTMDPASEKWWDGNTFPPLSIYSGGMDFLVLTEPLLDRLDNEESDVRLVRYKRQEEAEHCDHFWAADAVEWCFHDILADIESTRPRYPGEEPNTQFINALNAHRRLEPGTLDATAPSSSQSSGRRASLAENVSTDSSTLVDHGSRTKLIDDS